MKIKRNILLTPGPATTTDSVKIAQVVPDICPREPEFCLIMDAVRKKLVKVVHGDDRHTAVLLTASGTGGVEALISSVIPDSTRILIVNNGAYGERMFEIAGRYFAKGQIVHYRIPYGAYPDVAHIEKILSAHDNISHICVVHHETTTGMLNPVKEMARLAHERGVEMLVDAVSSYAGIDIHIEEDGFDYLISTSNKNIQGMAGVAFVITRKENLDKISGYPKRNLYLNLSEQFSAFEKNGQMRFTPPVQILYALNQALDEFFEETPAGRFNRYRKSWETLVNGLLQLGFTLLLPMKYQAGLITTVIEPTDKNYSFQQMHDYLYEKGFTIYPGKIGDLDSFRVGNIGAITSEDIQDFLTNLKQYIKNNYIQLT